MAVKDNVDFSAFSTPEQGFELFGNSVRRAFSYDSYGNKTRFKAMVLSNPIPISPDDVKLFLGSSQDTTSSGKTDKFVYRARIIGDNSPHQFLPDPCNRVYASDQERALNIIAMHTLFVSNVAEGEVGALPRINSIVEVELTKNTFGYNLQYGKHVNVVSNPDKNPSGNIDCDSLASVIANADSTISIGSMGQPQIRPYLGSAGAQDVENGKLPAELLVKSKYSSARFLVDVISDYDKLHEAFQARFGKGLILTDHYRTYSTQVSLKQRKPKLAARPGTSNHGWGLAFDFNHIDSAYGISGGKRDFESDVYKWLNANAPTYGFFNPPWAQEGGKNPEPWHFESTKKSSLYGAPKKNKTPTEVTDGEQDPTDNTAT